MILFVNFVPIEFMGGTEKWMHDTAKKVEMYEHTHLVSMHPDIANIHGLLIVKRKYDTRLGSTVIQNYKTVSFQALIPFTKKWKEMRKLFSTARLVYTRCEVLEILLVLYFSGIKGVTKKTIVGIHTPLQYNDPISFFDRLHNVLYGSGFYISLLRHLKKVHVLHTKDENYLKHICHLQNVCYVPNGVVILKTIRQSRRSTKKQLHVMFVGELSARKGIDILLQIIKKASQHITFTIAGDGYLQKDVEEASKRFPNVRYHGYVSKKELSVLYQKNDAIIITSRAESMSLAMLEAMSYGLVIINSLDTMLGLDKKIEYTCNNKNTATYVTMLEKLFAMKITEKLHKQYVQNYCSTYFSSLNIDRMVLKNIFGIYSL